MASEMVEAAAGLIYSYISGRYGEKDQRLISRELSRLIPGLMQNIQENGNDSSDYEMIQGKLAQLNEKEQIRKDKGVYYTPTDLVRFILKNSLKAMNSTWEEGELHRADWGAGLQKTMPPEAEPVDGDEYFCIPQKVRQALIYQKKVFDPTCGAGEFLLAVLELKCRLMDCAEPDPETSRRTNRNKEMQTQIRNILATIYGNDINGDSVAITKIRILFLLLNRYGAAGIIGIANVLNSRFYQIDFVTGHLPRHERYHLILGNPPYVEDRKSGLELTTRYGNIFANVLEHASKHLVRGGVMGFVIPLAYAATPRMKRIRMILSQQLTEQYLFSYSDRPDCLFSSVHQKLCIMIGKKGYGKPVCFTSHYHYWYREERNRLFQQFELLENRHLCDKYIPKLGNYREESIYQKIIGQSRCLKQEFETGETGVYLNMRAAFWMKAFLGVHSGSEYRFYPCETAEKAAFCMCLLNSSLFWWYWVCVSDCWHITNKELEGFGIPVTADGQRVSDLAQTLERRLEETKEHVGTKQTEYEYKHRECLTEIHEIDDYIHGLYGLTEEESMYIKQFAIRYRVSGGAEYAGC